MTEKELLHEIEKAKFVLNQKSRCSLLTFTKSTMPNFKPAEFHKRYYSVLTLFADGQIKKLMVFMPPQHGKSEGSTRRLPAYLLGKYPDTKIGIISYSATKARKFNREIQRIIDSSEYGGIFPETRLNGSHVTTTSGQWLRNMDECEIVGYSGGFKTVGVCGPLTGDPVDVLIMDDIYKDAKMAWSPVVRSAIDDWYDTVAETRLHNDSRQLIVFTRWHESDLAGKLLKEQGVYDAETNPDGWVTVKYQAIMDGVKTEYDQREEGEALWPARHSLEKLIRVRKRNPHVFQSLYQQDPKPLEGLMYEHAFREYEAFPVTRTRIVKNYTDTADTGSDYLCSVTYLETEVGNFVIDVLYTAKAMEYTEPRTAEMLTKHNVRLAVVESNNGGRGFARNVEAQCRIMGNDKTRFQWFHQMENKNVRIFGRSADVLNLTYFPKGWADMWPEFHSALTNYMKVWRNEHDDAPDAVTGTIEQRGKSSVSNLEGFFY
jgi:predicted phage terminase large subunit-like protein